MISTARIAARPLTVTFMLAVAAGSVQAAPSSTGSGQGAEHARVVEHWTPARRAAAIPRDLVIDERGYGYLKLPNGTLQPYGHTIAAGTGAQRPMAKPGTGTGDITGPVVDILEPKVGAIVTTAAYSFKATVNDSSGVRSVSFRVGRKGGLQSAFAATAGANGLYTVNLSGFADGDWTWSVVAKDNANNTTTTALIDFKVLLGSGGGGGGSGGVVTNAAYTGGGPIQSAVGRIYFEMPSNSRRTRWAGYVCSGTVIADGISGRSVIQTAAHCVYDDAYKAYARRVLFIPNQDGTTPGAGTDLNCGNDPLGCWTPSFGVVDTDWTTRTFPDNIPWDYAYYVVKDSGAHTAGFTPASDTLDIAVSPITVSFATPVFGVANSTSDYTTALGYSYSDDPNFMYCAEDLSQHDAANWLLASCGLSGGSSGGPWMQPLSGGVGDRLISVNSWGYTNQPGMYGPKLSGTSAECVFNAASSETLTPLPAPSGDGNAGYDPDGC